MPVIWGLDLKELQWAKFKSSYMFGNDEYHLRRTKFVVYQLAMILCVCSESVGTAALSDYVGQQSRIQNLHPSSYVYNNDFVGIASYNIFVGIAVATIFGAAFFFDLFFPERFEPKRIRWAWRLSSLIVSVMTLADALGLTIIVAMHTSWITADPNDIQAIGQEDIYPPLQYRQYGKAVASVVLLWLGLVATIASTYVMWTFYFHLDTYGPKSFAAMERDFLQKDVDPDAIPMR